MASATLKVTVNGGIAFFSITATLYKEDDKVLPVLTADHTFSHTYTDLEKGSRYGLYITGHNPAGGSVDCTLTTDEITIHPPDDTPCHRDGAAYNVTFFFTVN